MRVLHLMEGLGKQHSTVVCFKPWGSPSSPVHAVSLDWKANDEPVGNEVPLFQACFQPALMRRCHGAFHLEG